MEIIVIIVLAAIAVGCLLRYVTHRLATHQRIFPNPLARINTRVIRINQ